MVYMKPIGDRLGRQEKAKWESFGDWVKSKNDKHILLLHR